MAKKVFITVVSGYPRSGTSMMMQILNAGGLGVLIDNDFRPPNERNPKGFYEFEPAINLGKKDTNPDWLELAKGKAVKILAPQLHLLPTNYSYKVIFMRRKIKEILASAKKGGLLKKNIQLSEIDQIRSFKGEFVRYEIWLMKQSHMEALHINYNEVLTNPEENLRKVCQFLGLPLDLKKMIGAVDLQLHRQRDNTRD